MSMLNAFTPRSVFELPAKSGRIESVLAYGDKLLLGLSTGALHLFRVENPDSPTPILHPVQTLPNFSRSPITHLACIKEANLLLSLSDGNLNIHDLSDFSLTTTLPKARRASTLAVSSSIETDSETDIPELVSRLAVGVKRRVLLYSWEDGEWREGREVTLAGNVRTITWSNSGKVVVGLQSGFVVVDAKTGTAEEVMPVEPEKGKGAEGANAAGWASYVGMGGWGSRSLSTRLNGDEMLLVKDSTALFTDSTGQPLSTRPPITWSPPPDAVAYSYPYLVSLSATRHTLEVRNPSTWTLLQTIALPGATIFHAPPPNVALAHAGNLFFVASHNQVWRMSSTEYEEQVNELVDAGHLDEAIALIEGLEDVLLKENKEGKLREVKMVKATRLFERKKYEDSMALFAEVSAPPERVVKLFPKSIAGDISIWQEPEHDSDAEPDENDENEEPEVSDVPDTPDLRKNEDPEDLDVPRNRPPSINEGASIRSLRKVLTAQESLARSLPNSPRIGADDSADEASESTEHPTRMNGLPFNPSAFRSKGFAKKYADTASIFSFGTRRASGLGIHDDGASALTKPEPEPVKALDGDELKKAALELAGAYLNDVRRKLNKYFLDDGTPLDPADVLAEGSTHYDSRKDPLERSFTILEPGEQGTDQTASEARKEKVLNTSVLVYTTLFRIYILFRPSMVGPLVRIQNHCDPDVVSEKLREQGKFKDLVDFLERKQLHREALELLRFFGQQPPDDSAAPDLHGPERTITYLQRLKPEHTPLILEFSTWPLTVAPDAAMEIFTGDTGNSESLPRAAVLDHLETFDPALAVSYLHHLTSTLHDATPDFHTRLGQLYLRILRHDPPPANPADWHARFLRFLHTSAHYRREKLLAQLPRDDPAFYEARAIVLSKLARHKQALEIYVFRLADHAKAEAYCSALYADSPPDAPSPYHILLALYLRPPPPHEPQRGPALELLARHGPRLDAAEALALLPMDVTVRELERYFEKRARAATARVAEERMLAALGKTRLVGVQEEWVDVRRGWGRVGEETVCRVCHRRLGGSVIWRLPGGREGGGVVHYGCLKGV